MGSILTVTEEEDEAAAAVSSALTFNNTSPIMSSETGSSRASCLILEGEKRSLDPSVVVGTSAAVGRGRVILYSWFVIRFMVTTIK